MSSKLLDTSARGWCDGELHSANIQLLEQKLARHTHPSFLCTGNWLVESGSFQFLLINSKPDPGGMFYVT
jgi:hypothetical protein